MFTRVLVAHRGEIALRVIKACQRLGIETVAVYSSADARSPHLDEATETVCIGAAPSTHSYLNQEALLQAALQHRCQALHPGYGFLSENALFATRCAQQRTTFIGPSPSVLRLMGDKASARRTMSRFGIHGVPGSKDLVRTAKDAQDVAERIGYPVLLKATAGGGGKGMRICRTASELPKAFEQASLEAQTSFGDAGLYLERFVEGGRHIEIQVLGDRFGHVIHLGERECSTQRSNQKIIEEAPSPGVQRDQINALGAQLCTVLSELRYTGAGTVEFLMTPDDELFFMEMNTRLQVEHPVTELVTGIDLVEWQLRITAGERLTIKQDQVQMNGHAIECRINAEDPSANFRPVPGTLSQFEAPEDWRYSTHGPIRLDTHARSGYKIPTQYDSMIGKLIAHGATRDAATNQLLSALQTLCVEGVPTTIPLHQYLLDHPHFRSGQYNTPSMTQVMKSYMENSQIKDEGARDG